MFSASKTAAPVSGGFTIANSLRFRASASAYLNRTPASAGNQKTWTWSSWVKLGSLDSTLTYDFLSAGSASNTVTVFEYNYSGLRLASLTGGTYVCDLQTVSVFRDYSAWYHVVLVVDTTQASGTDRIKIYVNNVLQTFTGTYPPQNTSLYVNGSNVHYIGSLFAASRFFDGYLANVDFVDGLALTPSSFGQFDSVTGVWTPIAYTGTYGTNGFHLNFSNGTSTTTLGYDSSGNSNNWTTNNISLTAGSTYDWMIDSPSNFAGTSYGVGNYCVMNPVGYNASNTTADGNLYASLAVSSGAYGIRGTMAIVPSMKAYFEVTLGTLSTWAAVGILDASWPIGGSSYTFSAGSKCVLYYRVSGQKIVDGAGSSYGSTFSSGDVIGVAIDYSSNTCTFYLNNVSQGSIALPSATVNYVPVVTDVNNQNDTYAVNFGQRPFAYTPPSGYKSLCTQNLSDPSILIGNKYMDATLWTGSSSSTGASASIVNAGAFQPDFVWIKNRSNAYAHNLYDSVRGAGSSKNLFSNTTNAEGVDANLYGYVSALNSNGFTVTNGSDATYAGIWVNQSSQTFVGWQWKAGGAAVTNTAGSITSSVSANTTAGFSVVTYTGNGATSNQTVGHGLSSSLSMLILKSRTAGGNDNNWNVSHASIASPNYLLLNSTNAAGNYGPGQGQPNIGSGSTFNLLAGTVPGTNNVNASGIPYVAYCFAAIAGYSAFGSYTGNGSADGTFIYTGFRPRFVMTKRTDSTSDWIMLDTSRDTYNVSGLCLEANLSNAESTNGGAFSSQTDILSNGFKIRNSGGGANASGGTYIYAAFAENPFKYSLAR